MLIGQDWHPQPQEDFPAFLFLIILYTMLATIAIRIILIMIVDIFYASSNFVASTYFLKNSIYIIPAKTATAAINPMILILPPKAFPN